MSRNGPLALAFHGAFVVFMLAPIVIPAGSFTIGIIRRAPPERTAGATTPTEGKHTIR